MVLLSILLPVHVFAQDAERKTGFSFSVGQPDNQIAMRRNLTTDWTVLGALGYSHGQYYVGNMPGITYGPVASDNWALTAGIRRRFTSDELRPFVELTGGVRHANAAGGCDSSDSPVVTAGGGVEYFVTRRVSIEGSAGVGYASSNQRCSVGGQDYRNDAHTFSTMRTALGLTFYF